MKSLSIIFFWVIVHNCFPQEYVVQVKRTLSENWKYANLKGEIIISTDFPVSFEFAEDGVALIGYPKQNKHCIIDLKGEIIKTDFPDFDPKSTSSITSGFSNGLLVARIEGKWGAFNTEGKLVIPAKFDNLSNFNNDHAIGRINGTFYLIDKTGKETLISEPEIHDIKHFKEGLAPYKSVFGFKGFIDTVGNIAIPAVFSDVGYFSSGMAWARIEDKVGFINRAGKWAFTPKFVSAKDFDQVSDLALVKTKQGKFYVNKSGDSISFKNIEIKNSFSEGLAIGKGHFFYGFYNNKGEWAIDPVFEDLRDFRNGFAAAKKNNLWGIIDKKGNWVIEPIYVLIRDVIAINQ